MRLAIAAGTLLAALLTAAPGPVLAGEPEPTYFAEVWAADPDKARGELEGAGFDVAGVNRPAGLVGVVATAGELERLKELGWTPEVRWASDDEVRAAALADYTDPTEMSAFLDAKVAAFPNLVRKLTLRDTLFEGQKQYALLITKDVAAPNDRPSFIMDVQHHAREVMTPEIARDMIDYLTTRYATDAEVRRWVDGVNIYVVTSVNPDGAHYMFTTNSNWRRNRHPGCAVDNNRNYPHAWNGCNGSSGSCSSDTFRGTAPGSEPETQGVMQLTSDVRPFFALSYHSYGEYLMYPYGCGDPDEMTAMEETAQALDGILENDAGVTNQWRVGPIWSTIYEADGGSVDTQYARYGAYGYVIEVNTGGFQPDYATWRNVTVQRQRTAWKFFLDRTLDGPQVRGRITDVSTGAPLPGARVDLAEVVFTRGESPRTSDTRGFYHWLARAGQGYTVTASAPGYCPETRAVAVGTGPAVADFALLKPSVPQGVAAAPAGDNAIDVTWAPLAGADGFRVLRSLQSGGPYEDLGTVAGNQTSFHDAGVSGGVPYHYVVRSIQGCESANSAEVAASTTGPCTVGPAFAGLAAVSDAGASTCTLDLSWPAAATRCGGAVTYRVHRSTTAPFTPTSANAVAAGLTGTGWSDHAGLSGGTTYHYLVRAVDAGNGADDGNLVTRSGAPTGPPTVGTWTDDAGDSGAAKLSGTAPWAVQPTGGKAGPKVYATGAYSNNLCTSLVTPVLSLQTGSVLSFASKYGTETDYDPGIVEVAPGPAFDAWTKLSTVNYPDDLAFSGNACGIPTSGAGTVFARTNSVPAYPPAPYSGSLAAWNGQQVKLRWRFSTDGGVTGPGWWVDDVAVTNVVIPGACVSGAAPVPREPSAAGTMTAGRAAGTAVALDYTPACGAIDNAVYWGTGPIAGAANWSGVACAVGNTGRAVFDPGDPASGAFLYFVVVGQGGGKEGSYGRSTAGERPEAGAGLGACDAPQDLGGTCP